MFRTVVIVGRVERRDKESIHPRIAALMGPLQDGEFLLNATPSAIQSLKLNPSRLLYAHDTRSP